MLKKIIILITLTISVYSSNNEKLNFHNLIKGEYSIEKVEQIDFNANGINDYICRVRFDNNVVKEYWITDSNKIVKIFDDIPSYNYRWFVNLDDDKEKEIIFARGYEDGIDYFFVNFDRKTQKMVTLFYFNPIIKQGIDYFWGYPWDIDKLIVDDNKMILSSFKSTIERDDKFSLVKGQKFLPNLFFTSKKIGTFHVKVTRPQFHCYEEVKSKLFFKEITQNYSKNYLLKKEVQKIKKSNQSYQIYQKLNKYNILLMLIQSSTNFPPRKIYNLKKLYFADTVELENRIALLLRVEKEGEELTARDVNSYMTIGSFGYNMVTNEFYDNNHYIDAKYTTYAYPKVWSKIFNIYHLNQPREYLFLKEKTYLYKKPNLKSKSKKFLIKNDCALILDKISDGWYKVFYYHPHWHTNTIMWIKFDVDKHGLMG